MEKQNNTVEEIIKALGRAESIAITGHVGPDGDCYGSALAFYYYIESGKEFSNIKKCDIYLQDSEELKEELPGAHMAQEIPVLSYLLPKYDILVILDTSSEERVYAKEIRVSTPIVINIDHHASNPKYGNLNYVSEKSSTCEVLFDFIDENTITPEMAYCLYYGILTDTGGFKYSYTTGRTMTLAGICMESGDFRVEEIIDRAFDLKEPIFERLMGVALTHLGYMSLTNKGEVTDSGIVYSIIDRPSQLRIGYTQSERPKIGNIPQYLKSTKGCLVSIVFVETVNKLRVSLRSGQDIDVSKIAGLYGGGGHTTASGFDVYLDRKLGVARQSERLAQKVRSAVQEQLNLEGKTDDGKDISR